MTRLGERARRAVGGRRDHASRHPLTLARSSAGGRGRAVPGVLVEGIRSWAGPGDRMVGCEDASSRDTSQSTANL